MLAVAVLAAVSGKWDGLQAGLVAWEAFGFDSHFSVEVKVGQETVFHYPEGTAKAAPPGASKAVVTVTNASGGFLQQVTSPFVDYVMEGRDPANPAGSDTHSVSRHDLLLKGGGITLPQLAQIQGYNMEEVDGWEGVRPLLDAWQSTGWDVNFSVNAGNTEGTLFTHTEGSVSMNSRLLGASLSKWPAAMTVSGLVAEGKVNFEDKVNKYLDWWSKDPKDTRSNVTLRNLLTFQSGYVQDGEVLCAEDPSADYLRCARKLYESKTMREHVAPGTTFAYLSCHLQFAGAVAVAASGLNPKELFEKYFYGPLGTNSTTWGQAPFLNPQFATGITTTGNDFEKFLRGMLSYKFLDREVLSYAERDWSAPPVSPCGDGWFGHYGMGHWFDCLGYAAGTAAGSSAALPQYCLDENIQGGPGAYGYFPLIDRNRGYYLQVVLMEDPSCRSENPEYLRAVLKPVTDAAAAGKSLPSTTELLAKGGGVTLAEITDIYNCMPPQCTPPAWPPTF